MSDEHVVSQKAVEVGNKFVEDLGVGENDKRLSDLTAADIRGSGYTVEPTFPKPGQKISVTYTSDFLLEIINSECGDSDLSLIEEWVFDDKIFAIKVNDEEAFPTFQFDMFGRPFPIIQRVISKIGSKLHGHELLDWWETNNEILKGLSPKESVKYPHLYSNLLMAAEILNVRFVQD